MSKSRSLAEISHKIGRDPRLIENILCDLLAQDRALKVLEVGFGHGRVLLELAWHFRNENVTFYGVDKKQKPPVEKREDLTEIARLYQVIPEEELAHFELPELFFYDATRLHFSDESLDLIYSAVTMRFLERKVEFLEEVCRVLSPGGMALLQIGEHRWNYPYSLACDNKVLTPFASRIVLRHDKELIPLPDYLKLFQGNSFRFDFIGGTRCAIRISKLRSSFLQLQLRFNPELSGPMEELPYRHGSGEDRGGCRSVYDVSPEIYQALFASGILKSERLCTDLETLRRRRHDEEDES